MDITKGNVLVTGAGGFIGSHLVHKLLNKGCQVRAFLRYNSRNHYGNLDELDLENNSIEIVSGDLRDRETVFRAVSGCELVFHLGALIGIPYSYVSPADVIATNVLGTQNVLDAVRHSTVSKLVITSTSEVFGTPRYVPIDEKHPLQAQSPYAASKIAADKLAESYFNSFETPVTILRPFNTFGPSQSSRAVIPTIITQALTSDVIKLGSLEPRRDFLYVDDTVRGFIAAAECDSNLGIAVNIGTGGDVSIGDVVEQVLLILDKEMDCLEENQRVRPEKSEVQRLICNYQLATDLFSWQPLTSLEDGLSQTIKHISSHLDLYKPDIYNV